MKVLICGSRRWYDPQPIINRVKELPFDTVIISGAAYGVDSMAADIGRHLGLEVHEYPADWNNFGRSAGFRRNLEMLDQKPDLVIAFQRGHSRGTQHTIDNAIARGIKIEIHYWNEQAAR